MVKFGRDHCCGHIVQPPCSSKVLLKCFVQGCVQMGLAYLQMRETPQPVWAKFCLILRWNFLCMFLPLSLFLFLGITDKNPKYLPAPISWADAISVIHVKCRIVKSREKLLPHLFTGISNFSKAFHRFENIRSCWCFVTLKSFLNQVSSRTY